MPGNEVGDRIHNFFQQGNLSHSQHHSVEGNWPVFNNNICAGTERQISGPFHSKSSNAQQSDIEREQGNQFSQGPYGLNFVQSNLRPDFGKIQSQSQQSVFNGFMHAPTVAHARQNEANVLGMDNEPDRHNLTSRGLPLEAQQRAGPQHSSTSLASFGTAESPINFDFFGSQLQMSGQQPGIVQSLPRQHSGISDAQLMQQQVMFKQMQELQRHQQLQQFGAVQRNSSNHVSSLPNQVGINHSSGLVNGSPMNDASNQPWSSQLMMGNANWLQRGVSQPVQGFSNGLMITPEQGQAMRMMGLVPQQASQSLYGVPVSNARSTSPFGHSQMEKSGMHQLRVHSSSLSASPHAATAEQTSVPDGIMSARFVPESRNSFQHAIGQGPGDAVNMENTTRFQHRNTPSAKPRRQDLVDSFGSSIPEKSMKPAASSQSSVALDPTEVKILFGNDDNIWEAFGSSLSTGTENQLDGAFPAVQSGSWSALMQSAVAESSSGDMGDQGEWSGLGVQNSCSLTGSQQLSVPNSGKHQPGLMDGSQMASPSSRPFAGDASLNANLHYNSGFQQSILNQSRDSLQTNSGQQTSDEGSRWQDRTQAKVIGEGCQASQNVYSSAEFISNTAPGSWRHQQSTSSHVRQLCDRPNNLQTDDLSSAVNVNRDKPAVLSRQDSMPNSNLETSKVNQKGNEAPPISASSRVNEHSQKRSGNHGLDFWRTVGSVKSGGDSSGNYLQHLNKGPQILESSVNSSDRLELQGSDNGDRRENSSDSHGSNISHHASAGGLRENVWLDAGDSRMTSGDKQISSGPQGGRIPGQQPRKFQYHPMGDVNVDADRSYGVNRTMLSPASTQHVNRPVHSSQNMLELLQKVDQSKEQNVSLRYSSTDCGRSSALAEAEASDGAVGVGQRQSSSQGFGLQLAPPSQGLQAPNFALSSQCPSQGVGSPSASQISAEKVEKGHAWLSPAASVHSSPMHRGQHGESRNNRSAALGQPNIDASQRNIIGNSPAPFSGSQYLGSLIQHQRITDAGSKVINLQLANTAFDSVATHGKQVDDTRDRIQANHSPQISSALATNISPDFPSQREASQLPATDGSGGKLPVIQQQMSGIIQKGNFPPGPPNAWNHISTAQESSGSQYQTASNVSKFHLKPNEESGSFPQQKQDVRDSLRKGNLVKSGELSPMEQLQPGGVDPTQNIGITPKEKETLAAQFSNASPSNSSATQKDIEAFGRSLKPNNLHDNYSLLHQVQAMKGMVMDPSDRDMKRFEGPDNGPDSAGKTGQQFSGGLNAMVRNASVSHVSASSGDTNMVNFSLEASSARDRNASFQRGNVTSQDLFSVVRNEIQKSNISGMLEPSQTSPQMAPTWFDHCGTFRNGQLLAMHDMRRTQDFSNTEQQLVNSPKNSDMVHKDNPMEPVNAILDTGQATNVWRSAATCMLHQQLSSVAIPSQPVVASRPQKRKSLTDVLLPWHKEVSLGSNKLQNISCAEVDWARATNHSIDKVEDDIDVNEDVSHVFRPKRRLILTTQLMQQVFHPPPMAVLSLDASSNYETVSYFVARLALGDACGQLSYLESKYSEWLVDGNLPPEKLRMSGKVSDRYLAKVVEEFIDRVKKLESDLLRLDKRASILDLRLECQDLERFSVINRFAKFHGRGQSDGAETSSASISSGAARKPVPQRYVTALPMPRNLPDRVQCLSL